MKQKIKELREKRVEVFEKMKAIQDAADKEKRDLTPEETESFRKMEAESLSLRNELDAAEKADQEDGERKARLAEEERALAQSRGRRTSSDVRNDDSPTPEDHRLAFRGWCMGRHATPEMIAAAQRCGVNISQAQIDMAVRVSRNERGEEVRVFVPVRTTGMGDILEARALSVGTTTAGGNSVPNEVMRAFYEVQKFHARLRDQATVIVTETGATLPWPIVNDTANTGRILAEATAATTTTDPSFTKVDLGAFKFSSDAVLVSWELLQDSFIDMSGYLGTALGRRIARIQNTKFTVGAGTTEPQGLITGSTTVAAAATNAFTPDELITLVHSVDPAYRAVPGTGFMMHDTIAAYVRKFKDSQNRYLWEMSLQAGQPDRLLGYPVFINNDMASALTTGLKLVGFGNVKLGFLVRDAGAVRFVRSDEKYVLEHQVMFEASQRSSSAVIDTTAHKVLTLA